MILRQRAQTLIVIGTGALALATTTMRFHNDFLTGLCFGVALPMLALGVYKVRRSH